MSLEDKILFIINNQCSISRPDGNMRYIFKVKTIKNEDICMSESFNTVITGAIKQINKVREWFHVQEGSWLKQKHWEEWFDTGGFQINHQIKNDR